MCSRRGGQEGKYLKVVLSGYDALGTVSWGGGGEMIPRCSTVFVHGCLIEFFSYMIMGDMKKVFLWGHLIAPQFLVCCFTLSLEVELDIS